MQSCFFKLFFFNSCPLGGLRGALGEPRGAPGEPWGALGTHGMITLEVATSRCTFKGLIFELLSYPWGALGNLGEILGLLGILAIILEPETSEFASECLR